MLSDFYGAFTQDFEYRYAHTVRQLQILIEESDEQGRDLLTAVDMYRGLDAECAALFNTRLSGVGDLSINSFMPTLFGFGATLPPEIAARIGSNYTYWEFAEHVNVLAKRYITRGPLKNIELPGTGSIGDWMARKGGIWGAGQVAVMLPDADFDSWIHFVRSDGFLDVVERGGWIAGGVGEWALGDEHSLHELETQVLSSVIQGAIQTTGFGQALYVGDAAVQLLGRGTSELIERNALALTGGDVARAEELIATADRFQLALDAVSLDARIDGMVSSTLQGDWDGVLDEVETMGLGIVDVAFEGSTMTEQTVSAMLDNTEVDEAIGEFAADAGEAIDGALASFGL